MIMYDSDVREDGENYRAVYAVSPDNEKTRIKFLQPLETLSESQRTHDSALDYLLEQEEDLMVRKTRLEEYTDENA